MPITETAVSRPLSLTPEQRQDYLAAVTPIAQKTRKVYRIHKFAQADSASLADELDTRQTMVHRKWGNEQDQARASEELDCLKLAMRGLERPEYLAGVRQGYTHNLSALQEKVAITHQQSAENQVKAKAEQALAEQPTQAIDRTQYIAEMRPLADRLRDTRRFLAFFRETAARLNSELFNLQQTLRETPTLTRAQEDNYIRRIGLVQQALRANQAQTPTEDVEVERKLLNEIKSKAATVQIAKKVAQGEVRPLESIFVKRPPQAARPRPNLAVREPGSSTLPHHDLGQLYIHREIKPVTRLHADIAAECVLTWYDDPEPERVAMAVAQLLSQQVSEGRLDTPFDLKNPEEVAKGVVGITKLVIACYRGELERPSIVDLGRQTPQQHQHLVAFLQYELANCLVGELVNPNQDEDQLRKHFQRMSNSVRQMVEWITVGKNKGEATEKIQKAIEEGLEHDVQIAMLISRFSTNLYTDLGFPAIDFISSRRFAEIMRSSVFKHESLRPDLVENLVDVLTERFNAGDIDMDKLFADLDSLYYGDEVIRRVVASCPEDSLFNLFVILNATSYFPEARREVYDLMTAESD